MYRILYRFPNILLQPMHRTSYSAMLWKGGQTECCIFKTYWLYNWCCFCCLPHTFPTIVVTIPFVACWLIFGMDRDKNTCFISILLSIIMCTIICKPLKNGNPSTEIFKLLRLGNCNVAVAFRIYCLHKNHPIW